MKYSRYKTSMQSRRLQGHDYAGSAAYFVTIVTKGRESSFGRVVAGAMQYSALGRFADECISAIPRHFANADIDCHQVMPNHVHAVIVLYEPDNRSAALPPNDAGATRWVAPTVPRGPRRGSIGAIVGAYKMAVTRWAMRELGESAIWQRNYHDHIIRNDLEWQRIREYIAANPANWNQDQKDAMGAGW